MAKAVLVSDFDGTMTANDFYKLAVQRLLPSDALAPWEEYRAGAITHFTALQRIFGRLRATPEVLQALVQDMQPDPGLARAVADLRQAGWEIVVASAGCDWYIRQVLAQVGVVLDVHANPGEHVLPEGSLRMDAPEESPFYCLETGVDKAAIVRFHQDRGARVAFAGDGFADLPAALAAAPGLRFARADLAAILDKRREAYRPFAVWSDIARALLAGEAAS
ncbi:HAD-IB family phosphatase [Megalodesulfovibrio gigas]|uniref:Putative 2,3-diketo-5-methylthio-1-phosphopentane phosphatase n=1 Tax=Megalodesulfovibrio gigas (strain ATCC 19364 / DSM 1382 / NCIMB 9332 / VKM B-1759) TaxID=1121448 RepID=T2GAG0_MEGG1|nr:HAD-IB family phosphatase [Megalodesulfovibrio gigas]AGW12912.1 putative 2,3-diketo-5-methylthio-1-phosphopentane phosphatase [Megalodesulfovibrio gigas DSM 1382 = ATCC 19364]